MTALQSLYMNTVVFQLSVEANSLLKQEPITEERAATILQDPIFSNYNGKRYRFSTGSSSAIEKLTQAIFEKSFTNQPASRIIIDAAKKFHPEHKCFYPLWKRVCWIHVPEQASSFFKDTRVRVVLALVVSIGLGCFLYYSALYTFTKTSEFAVSKGIPFIINHAPLGAVKCFNRVMSVKDWACQNPLRFLFYTWIAKEIIRYAPRYGMPRIPYVTALAEQVHIFTIVDLIFPTWSFKDSGFEEVANAFLDVLEGSKVISHFFNGLAMKGKEACRQRDKEEAYQLWLKDIQSIRSEKTLVIPKAGYCL
jgi:hypothetical protein